MKGKRGVAGVRPRKGQGEVVGLAALDPAAINSGACMLKGREEAMLGE